MFFVFILIWIGPMVYIHYVCYCWLPLCFWACPSRFLPSYLLVLLSCFVVNKLLYLPTLQMWAWVGGKHLLSAQFSTCINNNRVNLPIGVECGIVLATSSWSVGHNTNLGIITSYFLFFPLLTLFSTIHTLPFTLQLHILQKQLH